MPSLRPYADMYTLSDGVMPRTHMQKGACLESTHISLSLSKEKLMRIKL